MEIKGQAPFSSQISHTTNGFFIRVHEHKPNKYGFVLIAIVTDEWFFSDVDSHVTVQIRFVF